MIKVKDEILYVVGVFGEEVYKVFYVKMVLFVEIMDEKFKEVFELSFGVVESAKRVIEFYGELYKLDNFIYIF